MDQPSATILQESCGTPLPLLTHNTGDTYQHRHAVRENSSSTVQQIYRWKEEYFRVVKIEAELILEANRLQLMKQDLEKAENAYLSSFTFEEVEDVTWCYGGSSWRSKWQE
ncbi:hypothetical protein TNCV_3022111 [Trichonephila clavipes]|nr:hypothetical protein TNCV_3022111 [Trichonephila clavipes]